VIVRPIQKWDRILCLVRNQSSLGTNLIDGSPSGKNACIFSVGTSVRFLNPVTPTQNHHVGGYMGGTQSIVSGHQWHHPTTAKGTDADDTAAQDPRIRQQVKELGFQHATASTRGTVPKGTTPSVIDRSSYQDRYGPTNCG